MAARKGFDPSEQIESIRDSTERIYRFLRQSYLIDRPTYGLVVGDVQSGKTANFCGLVSKAADLGISLIIVFSGTTNTLRNQTQKRIDEAFGRFQEVAIDWTFLTKQNEEVWRRGEPKLKSGDVTRKIHEIDLQSELEESEVCLLVVKKRQHSLEHLTTWITRHASILDSRQILFIDDESDSASVNCIRRQEDEIEDDATDIDEREATRINELIRTCIAVSHHSIYIGYTATPYAALLTDPWYSSEELGQSLYPRDFILTLPQPSEHNGTTEFFSDFGYLRDQVEELDRVDVELVNILEPLLLPPSLEVSIIDFIISGAIKLRNGEPFHHSMLVHCKIRKANHERLEELIRGFGQILRRDYRHQSFGSRHECYRVVKNRWENEFGIGAEKELEMDELVKNFLRRFDWMSNVRSINSTDDDGDDAPLYDVPNKLDYENHDDGLWVIAVGGEILSRGLTVEGLTISYFTRESAMYDSLTQMARWCGYHGSSHPLLRVRLSDQILRWFRWIYDVETRIREDIARYEEFPETTPLMLAPRILRYSETEPLFWEDRPRDFRPTRRGAMPTAEIRGRGFAGTYHSSRYLPLNNSDQLLGNQGTYHSLVEEIGDSWSQISGGYISRNIQPETILRFLRGFNHDAGERSLGRDDILNYIERRNAEGELINWAVAVMSPQRGEPRAAKMERPESSLPVINVTGRGKNPGGSIDEIMSKTHVAADLPGYPEEYQNQPSVRFAARQDREPQNGLLLVYILDSEFIPGEGSRGFIPLFREDQEKIDAVAFGIALPDSGQGRDEDQEEYWGPRGVPGDL
jgi:hypothetical protein